MDYEYLIAFVAVVFVVILVLIWFQILSQRKEMIVSQFVGIRRSVLWRMKMLYALRNTSFCMSAGCDDMLDRSADYVFDSVIQLFCGYDMVDCVDFRRCIDRTCHSGIWCRLEM